MKQILSQFAFMFLLCLVIHGAWYAAVGHAMSWPGVIAVGVFVGLLPSVTRP